MIEGAERKSELKGSIATCECQRVGWEGGRAEMEEERQKYSEIENHQGGWRESNLKANRWQREVGWEAGK